MTDGELAARLLLVVRSSQEKALRSRFTSTSQGNPATAAAVGSGGASPERLLEQAIAELTEQERLHLEAICTQLIESLRH